MEYWYILDIIFIYFKNMFVYFVFLNKFDYFNLFFNYNDENMEIIYYKMCNLCLLVVWVGIFFEEKYFLK